MKSKQIAEIFRKISQILELKGANPFRIRAYERAAQNIENLGSTLDTLTKKDKLNTIEGVGRDLADKIKEFMTTGELRYYEELKKEVPPGLIEMLEIYGLGSKTIKQIHDHLGISTVNQLKEAAVGGRLSKLDGIREKTQENILRGISLLEQKDESTPFSLAWEVAKSFIDKVKRIKEVKIAVVAGSLRRMKDKIKDIDILVASQEPKKVIGKFTKLSLVHEVLSKGATKSSVIAKDNKIQVDLRVVDKKSFGAALVYFTGSKAFNIKLRHLALEKNLTINEYGVYSLKNKRKSLAGDSEKDVFASLGMKYIPPEIREDRKEIELSLEGKMPSLVKLSMLKGDFHIHSESSDGINTIEEIAKAAKNKGYEYIGISDHSRSLRIAQGLSIKDLYNQIDKIKKINKKIKGIKVLAGSEIEILADGNLDYPSEVLSDLDFVIGAIHSGFRQSKRQLTKRIVSACTSGKVNFIAHPTGKRDGLRAPYELDFAEVLKAAADYNVALEINCHPDRLDLNDINVRQAKENGVKIFLGTDSHSIDQFELIKLGLNVARRGWLEKKDVINCLNSSELKKWLKK